MSSKIELVECDACPTSGGCVKACMKAAPVVERQPTGYVSFIGNGFVRVRTTECLALEEPLYTAPPELAELQATIADLRTELAVIKDECIDHVNLYKAWTKERETLTAENERLKGGQGEPVAYADPQSFENFKNHAHKGGLWSHEWMWAKPDSRMVPLYTSQPAPVSVDLPDLEQAFESWWESDGQYCRAGGGSYEKTFAYRAYEACLDKVKELNQ